MLLPERFIGGRRRMLLLAVRGLVLELVAGLAKGRAADTLVGIRSLFNNDLLVTALAGAATDGDEPEET